MPVTPGETSQRALRQPTMPAQPERQPRIGAEPTMREQLRRFLRRASVVGATATLAVHLVIGVIAALIAIDRPSGTTTQGADSEFEFAVATEEELAVLEQATPVEPLVTSPEVEIEVEVPLDSADLAPAALGEAVDLSGLEASGGGGSIGEGLSEGVGGAGSGGASFFGVEAEGSRFAFVIDVSGSMRGDRILQTQQALIRSVQAMPEAGEFFIVLYNGSANPLGGRRQWTDATDRNKAWARSWIINVQAGGGTQPLPAFQMVLGIDPLPDAIYFMTDGQFVSNDTSKIISLNRRPTIPVHAITFVENSGEEEMRKIARRSDGSYTHVPGRGR